MTELKRISLYRAEGSHSEAGRKKEVDTWRKALGVLAGWKLTAPEEGRGYHKVDATIEWSDGEVYITRVDLHQGMRCDLAAIVERELEFYAGKDCPTWVSEFKEKARRLLDRYSLRD